jgi:TolA-binding protein
MVRGFCVVMWVGFVAVMGCEQESADPTPNKVTSENVHRDFGQAVQTAVEVSQQTQQEYQQSLADRLTKLDAEIAKLREKGRDLKDQAKADWDQKLADLETKRNAARAKLVEVGHASAEAWKDIQQGAQSAWDELDKAVGDAAREF